MTERIARMTKEEWQDRDLKAFTKGLQKLSVYSETLTADPKEQNETTKKARRACIHTLAQAPTIELMREEMREDKRFFTDMITDRNAIQYKDVLVAVMPDPDPDTEWNATGRCIPGLNAIIMPYNFRDEGSLKHEMIHLHEGRMNDEEKENCKAELTEKLKRKIPQFDYIYKHWREALAEVTPPEHFPDSSHDDLFFLKSLDLDLRPMRFHPPLGTTFGYGMTEAIQRLTEEADNDTTL